MTLEGGNTNLNLIQNADGRWEIFHTKTNIPVSSYKFKNMLDATACVKQLEDTYDFSFATLEQFRERHNPKTCPDMLAVVANICKNFNGAIKS